jgi:PXPV repeat (3 copies)
MKTNKLRLIGLAGIAASAIGFASPALAHEGYAHVHYGPPRFFHPGHRVVIVQRPVFVRPPVIVYRPAPVYYAPAPVYAAPAPVYYAPNPAGTLGGAIMGAAIGGVVSNGRPGAVAAGSVIGAIVGSGLPR